LRLVLAPRVKVTRAAPVISTPLLGFEVQVAVVVRVELVTQRMPRALVALVVRVF
jgi:hypothetical protein